MKDTAEGCNTYLNRFPDGKHQDLAKKIILLDQQHKAWKAAKATNNKGAIWNFKQNYPDSDPVRSGELHQVLDAVEEEEMWKEACTYDTTGAYERYKLQSRLKKYYVW